MTAIPLLTGEQWNEQAPFRSSPVSSVLHP